MLLHQRQGVCFGLLKTTSTNFKILRLVNYTVMTGITTRSKSVYIYMCVWVCVFVNANANAKYARERGHVKDDDDKDCDWTIVLVNV